MTTNPFFESRRRRRETIQALPPSRQPGERSWDPKFLVDGQLSYSPPKTSWGGRILAGVMSHAAHDQTSWLGGSHLAGQVILNQATGRPTLQGMGWALLGRGDLWKDIPEFNEIDESWTPERAEKLFFQTITPVEAEMLAPLFTLEKAKNTKNIHQFRALHSLAQIAAEQEQYINEYYDRAGGLSWFTAAAGGYIATMAQESPESIPLMALSFGVTGAARLTTAIGSRVGAFADSSVLANAATRLQGLALSASTSERLTPLGQRLTSSAFMRAAEAFSKADVQAGLFFTRVGSELHYISQSGALARILNAAEVSKTGSRMLLGTSGAVLNMGVDVLDQKWNNANQAVLFNDPLLQNKPIDWTQTGFAGVFGFGLGLALSFPILRHMHDHAEARRLVAKALDIPENHPMVVRSAADNPSAILKVLSDETIAFEKVRQNAVSIYGSDHLFLSAGVANPLNQERGKFTVQDIQSLMDRRATPKEIADFVKKSVEAGEPVHPPVTRWEKLNKKQEREESLIEQLRRAKEKWDEMKARHGRDYEMTMPPLPDALRPEGADATPDTTTYRSWKQTPHSKELRKAQRRLQTILRQKSRYLEKLKSEARQVYVDPTLAWDDLDEEAKLNRLREFREENLYQDRRTMRVGLLPRLRDKSKIIDRIGDLLDAGRYLGQIYRPFKSQNHVVASEARAITHWGNDAALHDAPNVGVTHRTLQEAREAGIAKIGVFVENVRSIMEKFDIRMDEFNDLSWKAKRVVAGLDEADDPRVSALAEAWKSHISEYTNMGARNGYLKKVIPNYVAHVWNREALLNSGQDFVETYSRILTQRYRDQDTLYRNALREMGLIKLDENQRWVPTEGETIPTKKSHLSEEDLAYYEATLEELFRREARLIIRKQTDPQFLDPTDPTNTWTGMRVERRADRSVDDALYLHEDMKPFMKHDLINNAIEYEHDAGFAIRRQDIINARTGEHGIDWEEYKRLVTQLARLEAEQSGGDLRTALQELEEVWELADILNHRPPSVYSHSDRFGRYILDGTSGVMNSLFGMAWGVASLGETALAATMLSSGPRSAFNGLLRFFQALSPTRQRSVLNGTGRYLDLVRQNNIRHYDPDHLSEVAFTAKERNRQSWERIKAAARGDSHAVRGRSHLADVVLTALQENGNMTTRLGGQYLISNANSALGLYLVSAEFARYVPAAIRLRALLNQEAYRTMPAGRAKDRMFRALAREAGFGGRHDLARQWTRHRLLDEGVLEVLDEAERAGFGVWNVERGVRNLDLHELQRFVQTADMDFATRRAAQESVERIQAYIEGRMNEGAIRPSPVDVANTRASRTWTGQMLSRLTSYLRAIHRNVIVRNLDAPATESLKALTVLAGFEMLYVSMLEIINGRATAEEIINRVADDPKGAIGRYLARVPMLGPLQGVVMDTIMKASGRNVPTGNLSGAGFSTLEQMISHIVEPTSPKSLRYFSRLFFFSNHLGIQVAAEAIGLNDLIRERQRQYRESKRKQKAQ